MSSGGDDAAKFAEMTAYFEKRMAESKKVWASRGKEGVIAARAARPANSWRNLRGLPLMIHEVKHVGNRPFAWGLL
jgi:hypothetical protein